MAEIGSVDSGIFAGNFIAVIIIGFFAGRKKKESARDYFVTSSRLPW